MKINNIAIKKTKKKIMLSADIMFNGKKSEHVYFSTDIKYADFVKVDANPFLAAFLIPCMKRSEQIIIDDSVSKQLLKNTHSIMNLFAKWNIGMKKIKIHSTTVLPDTSSKNGTASFFSGGVDSFYTFLKHRRAIKYFVLIYGFDIELGNELLWKKTLKNVESVALKNNILVIPVKTNIKRVIEKYLIWNWGHGGALSSVGLFLRNGLKQIYISASVRHDQLFPWGSHPELDRLWGTETLEIVHDGTEFSRTEKVARIVRSHDALSYLHVCNQNRKGFYNCGKCHKCLQTMIELVCVDALKKVKTFPHVIDYGRIKTLYHSEHSYALHFHALKETLHKKKRDQKLQEAIEESLTMNTRFSLSRSLINFLKYLDREFNDRRFYRLIFSMNKKQDRNLLFKALTAGEVIH